MHQFRQPMQPVGPVQQPYSYSFPSPHSLFKNSSKTLLLTGGVQIQITQASRTKVDTYTRFDTPITTGLQTNRKISNGGMYHASDIQLTVE